jgi:hypothetical protein
MRDNIARAGGDVLALPMVGLHYSSIPKSITRSVERYYKNTYAIYSVLQK